MKEQLKYILRNICLPLAFIVYTIFLYTYYQFCLYGFELNTLVFLIMVISGIISIGWIAISIILGIKKYEVQIYPKVIRQWWLKIGLIISILMTSVYGFLIVGLSMKIMYGELEDYRVEDLDDGIVDYCLEGYSAFIANIFEEEPKKQEPDTKHLALEDTNVEDGRMFSMIQDLCDSIQISEHAFINEFLVSMDSMGNLSQFEMTLEELKGQEIYHYKVDYSPHINPQHISIKEIKGESSTSSLNYPFQEFLEDLKQLPFDKSLEITYKGIKNITSVNLQDQTIILDRHNQNINISDVHNNAKGTVFSTSSFQYIIVKDVQAIERSGDIEEEPSLIYFLKDGKGYSLRITDAATGSYFYVLDYTTDGGKTWDVINKDPCLGNIGVAGGVKFLTDKIGYVSLTHGAGDRGELYYTNDGGRTFQAVEHLTSGEYDYVCLPYIQDNQYYVKVVKQIESVQSTDYLLYKSANKGKTWVLEK